MTTPIDVIPKIVTLVQCAMALCLCLFVASDHIISAFQQGHQVFPLFKLKDSGSDAFGYSYHSLLPMVHIHLDHIFP
jgi:hypothetical protein